MSDRPALSERGEIMARDIRTEALGPLLLVSLAACSAPAPVETAEASSPPPSAPTESDDVKDQPSDRAEAAQGVRANDENAAFTLTLLAGKASLANGVEVTLKVTNTRESTEKFCDYHTPFEGIRNDIFEVIGPDGNALPYQGMMAKRAPPGPDDYIDVKGGDTASATVDLREVYPLKPGVHRVRYTGFLGSSNVVELDIKP